MLTYLVIVGPAMILAALAHFWVKSAYSRYSNVPNASGLTGAQAAAEMLAREGVRDVKIEAIEGTLSDHYDPSGKVLRLSADVYNGHSVAAVGIACHEAGHALQHAHGYAPLSLRTALVPLASIGSNISMLIFGFGALLAFGAGAGLGMTAIKIGVVAYSMVVLFQLVTLPVEFNASSRAKAALINNQVISSGPEADGVNSVLNAAAMTYVAAAVGGLAELLYWLIRLGLFSGRDEE